MNDIIYDVPIREVAKILEKSDRQVRRYVKDRRLVARPIRVDGHIKLMFNRNEVTAYRERFSDGVFFGESGQEIVVDAQLIGDDGNGAEHEHVSFDSPDIDETGAVKYVIDTLRDQIKELQQESNDLHYQLEQRSGQVGFLQGKVEMLQEEIKMLMPAMPTQDEIVERKPWYRRLFGR